MVGKPRRTIIWGRSRGGITARAALQLLPGEVSTAVSRCAAAGPGLLPCGILNWTLPLLLMLFSAVNTGIKLQLNNITDLKKETDNINYIVTEARKTPEGRARIALAAAFSQIATWNSPSQPEPAKDDYEAQANNQASQIAFALGTSFVPFLEGLAGGPFTWNHGIDYRVQLARSGYEKLVKEMYKKSRHKSRSRPAETCKSPESLRRSGCG